MITLKNNAVFLKMHLLAAAVFVLVGTSESAPHAADSSGAEYSLDSSDVKTIDGIVAALYDVISGEPGPRNWERLRALCTPAAQFNASVARNGKSKFHSGTVEKYINANGPYFMDHGFYEKEIHRVIERYGNIAHIFSTYETREAKNGAVKERGINSIQLVFENSRWWVVNVMWTPESREDPLPERYLGK